MQIGELAKDVRICIISGNPLNVIIKYDEWVARHPYDTIISMSQMPGPAEGTIYLTIVFKEGENADEIF